MSKETRVIGRCQESAIDIPDHCTAVSHRHARITPAEEGHWLVEDCQSTNGTFLRDTEGEFRRIYAKEVARSDVLRLGEGGGSFTFTTHRLENPTDGFAYEFRQLRRLLAEQKKAEERKEKAMVRNGWISRCSGIVALIIFLLIGSLKNVSIDPTFRYVLIASAPVLVGFLLQGDAAAIKRLRRRRERLLVCPKCFRPLSEMEIEQGKCFKCGVQ